MVAGPGHRAAQGQNGATQLGARGPSEEVRHGFLPPQNIALHGLCWAITSLQHHSGKGLAGMEGPIVASRADFECSWCVDFGTVSKTNFLDPCSRPLKAPTRIRKTMACC